MLPDTGERYLSTPLFDDIGADMDGRGLELSRSTPGYRFDAPPRRRAARRPRRAGDAARPSSTPQAERSSTTSSATSPS